MPVSNIVVLLSTYNGEKYITEQIKSILNQRLDIDLKIIIRDDGSTDSTVKIIERLERNDGRISHYSGDNIGCVASFFDLIRYAYNNFTNDSYYSLADQDDVWDVDKLQISVDVLKNLSDDRPFLYASSSRPVNENLEILDWNPQNVKEVSFYNTIIQNFTPGHTYVFNYSLLSALQDVQADRIYVHDSYILNAALLTGNVFYDINPHTNYRQHEGNQLGTSEKTFFSWAKDRIKRIRKGDSKKYALQIEYIFEQFDNYLDSEEKQEISCFLNSRSGFFKRFIYIIHTKLYRQEKIGNLAFKILYLIGGYNTK